MVGRIVICSNWIAWKITNQNIKNKKTALEVIKNDKKSLIITLFVISTFAYFYPVIKHSQNKLNCEMIAKTYIIKNKNIIGLSKNELKMLSTNFCYGGEEIYEIKNLKN